MVFIAGTLHNSEKIRYLIFYMSINISKSIKMSFGDKLEIFDGHMFDKPSLFTAWK